MRAEEASPATGGKHVEGLCAEAIRGFDNLKHVFSTEPNEPRHAMCEQSHIGAAQE